MRRTTPIRDPVQAVLAGLEGVRQTGKGQWEARCPAHDDRRASLSIARADDGRALLHCHAGCALADILACIGLTEADLFAGGPSAPRWKPTGSATGVGARRIVAAYDYRDAEGKLLFQVVRFQPKGFRQRHPDGKGGWVWNLNGAPRVLYRLPELLAADPSAWVFVPEGEKDTDNRRACPIKTRRVDTRTPIP
jgi:putative DNA primase/helicase